MKTYSKKRRFIVRNIDTYRALSRSLSVQETAQLLGVTEKTVYKWMAGRHKIDDNTALLLRILALGILPHRDWQGFFICERGKLVTRNGFAFTSHELDAFALIKQENCALKVRIAELLERLRHPEQMALL